MANLGSTKSGLRTMSRANNVLITGTDQVVQQLNQLPEIYRQPAFKKVLKGAAEIVKIRAKRIIMRHAEDTDDGFSKVRFVAMNIVVTPQITGVKVHVKGPDVPVKGSRYGYWNIQGYAKLLSAGAYITRERHGKGQFSGFGNFVVEAYEENKGVVVTRMRLDVKREIERVNARLFRKAARTLGQ